MKWHTRNIGKKQEIKWNLWLILICLFSNYYCSLCDFHSSQPKKGNPVSFPGDTDHLLSWNPRLASWKNFNLVDCAQLSTESNCRTFWVEMVANKNTHHIGTRSWRGEGKQVTHVNVLSFLLEYREVQGDFIFGNFLLSHDFDCDSRLTPSRSDSALLPSLPKWVSFVLALLGESRNLIKDCDRSTKWNELICKMKEATCFSNKLSR